MDKVPLDTIVDDGEEIKNLFNAISTQRRIAELRNIIPSGSGAVNRLKLFAEEKFRHAMAELSQGGSEVGLTLDLSTSIPENIFIIQNKMQILARRSSKVCVYSRDKITNVCEGANRNVMNNKERNIPLELKTSTLLQTFANYFPKATYFISAAYRCNYYFSCLEDYQQCLPV